MERLKLTQPVERQWIYDESRSEFIKCPNQMNSSYASFLEYLEMIQKMGKGHWRSLKWSEDNPNFMHQEHTWNGTFNDDSQMPSVRTNY